MPLDRPGALIDQGPLIPQVDFSRFQMRIPTERYHSREYQERERQRLWMRVWQIAGREAELPDAGDWLVYRIFDQSFIVVRGNDGALRGFVNSCRHRGNALCEDRGHTARFLCPYHHWSFGLDGRLLAVPRPDFDGTVEEFVGPKEELGLWPVPVESFAGFIFLNPDPTARPLRDFLGDAAPLLRAYRLEEMVPVDLNVTEAIQCNWKVVMDAFHEGYHVRGVHPELVSIMDMGKERFTRLGPHGATTVPFGQSQAGVSAPESELQTIRAIPFANFPALATLMPRFEERVATYHGKDDTPEFPPGVTARGILQNVTREMWTAKGLDVSDLTDNQMNDYQFWALFPNVFMQLGPGDATVIIAKPDAEGDPNRCAWHVCAYRWLPVEQRATQLTATVKVPAGEHFAYFLALEQDYRQMERQQHGLRNTGLKYMTLTRQEPRVAHFHTVLDDWIDAK